MTNYIFDLDMTLYQDNGKAEQICDARVITFFMERLDLDAEQAQELQKDILRQYHWEAEAVENRFGIPEKEFMDYICDVDVSHLPKNPKLNEQLSKLSGRRFIFSDSTLGHVKDTLQQIDVDSRLFERIYVAEHNNFLFKFQPTAFAEFCRQCQIDPKESIIFEDSLRNIKRAKESGFTTVLISSQHQDAPDTDYQFANINQALEYFLK